MKMKKYLLFPVVFAVLLIGCLSDTITGPQAVSRPIFRPGQVFYRSVAPLNLEIRWNPSPKDTQLNFRGHYIELFRSPPYYTPTEALIDSLLDTIALAHVPTTHTTYPFINK